jgi:transcriptional regulator with XRE-family HTH domain
MPAGRAPASEQQRNRARDLQKRLTRKREALGMNLEDLARRADVNRRTLDKYLQGDSPSPSFFLVVALARALDIDLDSLAPKRRRNVR